MTAKAHRPPCARRTLACAAALLLCLTHGASAAETITLGGTGAGLGTMKVLAAGFAKVAPAVTVVVVPNLGSGGGLKALAAGAIDVAVITRALKPEETAQGLVAAEYGKTPFVIATARSGAAGFRTIAELSDLYSGRQAAWPDGTPIRLVMRPRHDSDFKLLESLSPAMKQAMDAAAAKPGMLVTATDQEAADAIEKTPGAIGSTVLALILTEKRGITALPINGVSPGTRALADGSYPYFKSMHLVRKAAAKPDVDHFLAFVASAQGRKILQESGHWVPAARTAR